MKFLHRTAICAGIFWLVADPKHNFAVFAAANANVILPSTI